MVSQIEFEKIIESYLWELQANNAEIANESVLTNLKIKSDIDNFKQALQAEVNHAQILSFAIGLVDEYTSEFWPSLMKDAYQLYLDRSNDS